MPIHRKLSSLSPSLLHSHPEILYFSYPYKETETWLKRIRVFESTLFDEGGKYLFLLLLLASDSSFAFCLSIPSRAATSVANRMRAHAATSVALTQTLSLAIALVNS